MLLCIVVIFKQTLWGLPFIVVIIVMNQVQGIMTGTASMTSSKAQKTPLEEALGDVHSQDIGAIWAKLYGYLDDKTVGKALLVCKMFCRIMPSLVKEIALSSPVLDPELLASLALKYSNLKTFLAYQDYDNYNPVLDWSKIVWPHLQELDLNCSSVSSIEFKVANTPNLRALSLEHPGYDVRKFDLELPQLTNLLLRSVSISSALLPE